MAGDDSGTNRSYQDRWDLGHLVEIERIQIDAIWAIKVEYGIKKNWMGDPCFPSQFKWDGVECGNTSNQLNGPIPDSLCKLNEGSLVFSYGSNGDVCNKTNLPGSKKRAAILAISIAAPVLEVKNIIGIVYKKNENRHFTYDELKKLTDNFQQFIGEGGFGCVYHGYLEDNTEVAVKIHSEKSSHGFNEFLAELESLTKFRHKNLVSLVGYCSEKAHLALIYEYMPRGNLFDLLRDKTGVGESLNWAMRVRVLLDAAQGLDCLHTGCNRPIIHRDVKTSNILLDQNLHAKIADFGLSKIYLSDMQSGLSTTVAGTMGYIDPEVTESNDVYSFGVVLLEVATGNGHIIQHVKEKVASGDISSIADERLNGGYNVVEIALLCTEPLPAQRPSMTTVVVQMESLSLEVAREDRGLHANPTGDAVATSSTFDPSAR
uniref:Protein kinase domain-containing protein n=1 Tax=Oryza barthii TaxID=65489 RepID=A0A0D3H5V6_9ORYZ